MIDKNNISKNDLLVGQLLIKNVFDDNGEFHFRQRTFDAECECGKNLTVSNWDIALKRITYKDVKGLESETNIRLTLLHLHLYFLLKGITTTMQKAKRLC